jgi:hypothetical protein
METTAPFTLKRRAKFNLGTIVITQGADQLLRQLSVEPESLIIRHMTGDWGDVCAEDAAQNERYSKPEVKGMILSSYEFTELNPLHNNKIWVITDAGHEVTTILMPDEY